MAGITVSCDGIRKTLLLKRLTSKDIDRNYQRLLACHGPWYFGIPQFLQRHRLEAPEHKLAKGRYRSDGDQPIRGPSQPLVGSTDEPENEETDGEFHGPKCQSGEEKGVLAEHPKGAHLIAREELKMPAEAACHAFVINRIASQIEDLQRLASLDGTWLSCRTRPKTIK